MTTNGTTYVAYLRVSTARQGRSGLGLEAQQVAIDHFLRAGDKLLAPPFVEVESGRNPDRPKLREALAKCRKAGATLLIAKLDRLGRNVHFISGLMESGVPFVAADMPTAAPFELHVRAAMAEEEARAISARTKAALGAAKARGAKLGGYRGGAAPSVALARQGAKASAAVRSLAADHAAHRIEADLRAVIAELGERASLHGIAAALEARGVVTPRGGRWTATAVRRAMGRTNLQATRATEATPA